VAQGILSKTLPTIDVPEATEFSVSFEYYGYAIDEALSLRGAGNREVLIQFVSTPDSANLSDLLYIDALPIPGIDFTADDIATHLVAGGYLDESTSYGDFTGIILQDMFIEDKVVELLESYALGLDIDLADLNPADAAPAITAAASEAPDSTVGDSINDEIVSAILQQGQFNESNNAIGTAPGETIVSSFKNIEHVTSVDSRVAFQIARIATKNAKSAFAGNFSYASTGGDLANIQTIARDSFIPEGISEEEFVSEVDPFSSQVPIGLTMGEAEVFGYLLEKTQLLSDGTEHPFPAKIFLEGSTVTADAIFEYRDTSIELASTYVYSLSSLAMVRLPSAMTDGFGALSDLNVIARSRLQVRSIVTGVEVPNPPENIEFVFEEETDRLLIQWSLASDDANTKKFQVFRRNSINEPFALIRQYDFDDSEIPVESLEDIDFGLDVKLDEELLYYIDEKFKRGKEYIYALCAIGSDGGSSAYSVQHSVRYDEAMGSLVIKRVSEANAPKPYPNFYLPQQMTLDVGKISNTKQVEFYFTPEVYNLTRNEFNEHGEVITTDYEDFIKDGDAGFYTLELTEIGTLQQKTIKVNITATDEPLILDPTISA